MVHMGRERRHVLKVYVTAILMVALVLTLFPAQKGDVTGVVAAQAAQKADQKGINETSISLKVGEKANLFVNELEPGDKVTYKTSKKKVAAVAATGVVTAKKKGTAAITVSVSHTNGTTDSYICKVKVAKPKKQGATKFTEIFGKQEFLDAVATGKDGAYKLGMGMIGINNPIPIASDIILDLNGQLVRGDTEYGLFQVVEGGSLTIMDSSESKSAFAFNTGKGGVVDCIEGSLVIESGMLMSDGERVIYSSDELIINGGSISGGSKNAVYIADGDVQINGGSIMSSPRGICQFGGKTVINDVEVEASADCLFLQGGMMEVCGGKLTVNDLKGHGAAIIGGTMRMSGGTVSYSSVGVIMGGGQFFLNGGEIVPCADCDSYGVYAANTDSDTQITINGGSVVAKYAGVFLENVKEGSVVVNGGNIKSTGPVGITAKDCAITINGGKVECENTVLSINNGTAKSAVKGGTFTGGVGLVVNGKADVKVTGGKFKAGEYGLVINSGYEGQINYPKDSVGKVLDQRKGGEKDSDSDPEGYRRIDVKYKEGMQVNDLSTLYSLFCDAFENLTEELNIFVSQDLFFAVYKNFSDLFGKYSGTCKDETTRLNAQQISHSDGRTEYTIKFNYGIESQINSVALNKDAYKNADKAVQKYSDEIDAIIDSIITKDMTDEEKVKAVNDYMCEHYAYADPIVEDGPNSDHSFHSMLDDGTGVCQGYATLFHVMMLKLGIDDTLVVGKGSSDRFGTRWEDHMWNCVVLDGKQMFVDVTWNDSLGNTDYLLKNERDFYADGLHRQDKFWK